MNRSGEKSRQEFKNYQQKLTKRYMKWENDHSDSNMAERPRPLRREADSNDLRRLNDYIRRVRAIFRAPTSSPDIAIIPRPVTVGTQTWPTTTFKPLKSIHLKNKDTTVRTDNTPDSKANAVTKCDSKAKNCQPNLGKNKRVVKRYKSKRPYQNKSKRPYQNKSKWVKTVGFNVVSKNGRYDHATVKRSVIPVFNAKPSGPFQ